MKKKKDTIIGEVLTKEEMAAKKKALETNKQLALNFGSYVTKSNDLIQKTKYSLPRTEQKVLFMLMSKIDQKNDTDPMKAYEISFEEFARLTGVQTIDVTYFKYLKQTIESLASRGFWMRTDEQTYRWVRWLGGEPEIKIREKKVRLQFGLSIWPMISQLTSNYTSYNIEYLLRMKSTYSMRVYEIILSYDNGNRDYGYTNGLVFQPVTKDLLGKFASTGKPLNGYKYKRFDMEEFKGLLSVPSEAERENGTRRKKKEYSPHDREKPLSEKYPSFADFERRVLRPVKEEINGMTDLWFDYEPAKNKGSRKYEYLYIFIKYKSKEEMQEVRTNHEASAEKSIVGRKTKSKKTASKDAHNQAALPFSADVMDMRFTRLTTEIKNKAEYSTYESKLTDDEKNILNDIFVYTAKILVSVNKKTQAQAAFDSLNRIIADNSGLKTWALGMCVRFKAMLANTTEKKSAQYYRTVVCNDIIENSAVIVAEGKRKLEALDADNAFGVDMMAFEDL